MFLFLCAVLFVSVAVGIGIAWLVFTIISGFLADIDSRE